jgi:hypothetical protein
MMRRTTGRLGKKRERLVSIYVYYTGFGVSCKGFPADKPELNSKC